MNRFRIQKNIFFRGAKVLRKKFKKLRFGDPCQYLRSTAGAKTVISVFIQKTGRQLRKIYI